MFRDRREGSIKQEMTDIGGDIGRKVGEGVGGQGGRVLDTSLRMTIGHSDPNIVSAVTEAGANIGEAVGRSTGAAIGEVVEQTLDRVMPPVARR